MKITGFVREFDPASRTFFIGGLLINYVGASISRPGGLVEGALVDAAGHLLGDTVFAQEITSSACMETPGMQPGEHVRLEGPIVDVPGGLMVSGIWVRLLSGTQFDRGLDRIGLKPGLHVVVQGAWSGEGEIIAAHVAMLESDAAVTGRIESVDSIRQELVVGGIRVRTSARTELLGGDGGTLPFCALWAGDYLDVIGLRGEDDRGMYVDAIRLSRDEETDDDTYFVQGRVDGRETGHRISILGARLRLDDDTRYTALAGAAGIRTDDFLVVDYHRTTSGYLARHVELEDDDTGHRRRQRAA